MIKTENFQKLMSDSKPQIQETQTTISRINAKKNLHVGISYSNCIKSKIKILEEARGGEKYLIFKDQG